MFEQEKKASKREILSSQLAADSFVISGVQGLKNFRVRAAARGTEVRGVTVLYDQATEGTMDRIAAAVIGAFAAFPDLNASRAAGIRRMVEYGTAIVVSGDGDLITTAHGTDDCQAITLPGLGHVERVATDKANDLALLHVYGARNLVPAALAGDANGADFKLIGVADPLAQAGAAEVTSAVCRRTRSRHRAGAEAGVLRSGRGRCPRGCGRYGGFQAIRRRRQWRARRHAGTGRDDPRVPASARHYPAAATSDHAPIELSVVRVACVRK